MTAILPLLFQMLIGHAVADFVMQPKAMGFGKNRNNMQQTKADSVFPRWYYWMTAHALVHGGAVYIISGSAWLGLIETILHWCIDFAKCERWINLHVDQMLHIVCKLVYCLLIYNGMINVNLLTPLPL